MSGVTPKPFAAFSMLTTQKSMACCWRSAGTCLAMAERPDSPNTSPTIRMFMASLLRHFDRAGLPDDHDLDVAGVLHLGLDALGDVLGELVGVEIADDVRLGDHAQLAAGLDRIAHLDALVAERDLLQLRQPLDVRLQHVAAGTRARRRDA